MFVIRSMVLLSLLVTMFVTDVGAVPAPPTGAGCKKMLKLKIRTLQIDQKILLLKFSQGQSGLQL